jgi:hypothetical protein
VERKQITNERDIPDNIYDMKTKLKNESSLIVNEIGLEEKWNGMVYYLSQDDYKRHLTFYTLETKDHIYVFVFIMSPDFKVIKGKLVEDTYNFTSVLLELKIESGWNVNPNI